MGTMVDGRLVAASIDGWNERAVRKLLRGIDQMTDSKEMLPPFALFVVYAVEEIYRWHEWTKGKFEGKPERHTHGLWMDAATPILWPAILQAWRADSASAKEDETLQVLYESLKACLDWLADATPLDKEAIASEQDEYENLLAELRDVAKQGCRSD